MQHFIFQVANIFFFAFKLVFAPYSADVEPALLGMSLTTLDEEARSRVAVAQTSDY